MGPAYYNENDTYAADWLENLILVGVIAPGVVDRRSIVDVRPRDLRGFAQCHFFAGIGVWSHALRGAGWPDDRPVWTGSCPCQPFSAAGRGGGFDDERHLWPAWQHLIDQCRPAVVLGEQVASKDAEPWLDLVQDDMEGMGYAFGAVPFPAASVGAPHIRDRLYWVADAERWAAERRGHDLAAAARGAEAEARERQRQRVRHELGAGGDAGGRLADGGGARLEGWLEVRQRAAERSAGPSGVAGGVGDTTNSRQAQGRPSQSGPGGRGHGSAHASIMGATGGVGDANGERCGRRFDGPQKGGRNLRELVGRSASEASFWSDAEWIPCRDGKWRPVEPGTFPLAHGAPARVGRLRAYGNAIVAPQAEVWIRTVMECIG